MLKLKRLKIHKFRSVAPGTELVFNDGFNLLLGKNGTGKTTLLKLIAAAVGSSFATSFKDESLHVEYAYALGDLVVACELRQDISYSVDDLLRPLRKAPSRRSVFAATIAHPAFPDPISASIEDDLLTISYRDRTIQKTLRLAVGFFLSFDLLLASAAAIEGDAFPAELYTPLRSADRMAHRLDEALDWLRALISELALFFSQDPSEDWCVTNARYAGAAPAFQAALAGYRGAFTDLPEILSLHGEQLTFLQDASARLGLQDITINMALVSQQATPSRKTYGKIQAYALTRSGDRFPLEQLSFGQLRLFAFFFYAAMHPHVIVADELTNGLHHEMIRACIDTIGERQAFLATQNPLLLDHLSFTSAEEVQRTFILCDLRDEADGQQTMLWRNMTADEAGEFFKDYQVGIQHVNDILRTRGLW